ncbi:MAG: hypothetical protein H7Y60_13025 [Rhodospirillaceae bacterium]|nr:hypothetical protein [Rhodospirillales bacterium]
MRIVCMLLVLTLSACGGYHSSPSAGEQTSSAPTASGGSYMRDGFYDGGISDPDVGPRGMRLPE